MKCEVCGVEMRIVRTFLSFAGDESAEEKTEAFRNTVLACRNRACPEEGKEARTIVKKLEG